MLCKGMQWDHSFRKHEVYIYYMIIDMIMEVHSEWGHRIWKGMCWSDGLSWPPNTPLQRPQTQVKHVHCCYVVVHVSCLSHAWQQAWYSVSINDFFSAPWRIVRCKALRPALVFDERYYCGFIPPKPPVLLPPSLTHPDLPLITARLLNVCASGHYICSLPRFQEVLTVPLPFSYWRTWILEVFC